MLRKVKVEEVGDTTLLPLAFIAEQAGGKASDGHRNIMEIEPTSLHQRVPYFVGPKSMVDKLEDFIKQE